MDDNRTEMGNGQKTQHHLQRTIDRQNSPNDKREQAAARRTQVIDIQFLMPKPLSKHRNSAEKHRTPEAGTTYMTPIYIHIQHTCYQARDAKTGFLSTVNF
eukprot:TRINITY_DN14679_c0_g1_i1.p1 TRINITY_DN14679_c0_g1~~TRINITY_DN14679_c0_g1_i1.p1  ORF type:complete len:101 (-),score=6.16 TRINITY_DN14679_c0_g1_i1:39-341(-)